MILKTARRVVIAVVGSTVVLIGVVGIPAPLIPAIVLIPADLAILALEFAWAARLLKRMKQQARKMFNSGGAVKADKRPTAKTETPAPATSR